MVCRHSSESDACRSSHSHERTSTAQLQAAARNRSSSSFTWSELFKDVFFLLFRSRRKEGRHPDRHNNKNRKEKGHVRGRTGRNARQRIKAKYPRSTHTNPLQAVKVAVSLNLSFASMVKFVNTTYMRALLDAVVQLAHSPARAADFAGDHKPPPPLAVHRYILRALAEDVGAEFTVSRTCFVRTKNPQLFKLT